MSATEFETERYVLLLLKRKTLEIYFEEKDLHKNIILFGKVKERDYKVFIFVFLRVFTSTRPDCDKEADNSVSFFGLQPEISF